MSICYVHNTVDFRQLCNHCQVSSYTFVTPLASSMVAPALPALAAHYDITSETIVAMTLSIFLVTFAIGPLFLAPLSEIYGRTWVSTYIVQAMSCYYLLDFSL